VKSLELLGIDVSFDYLTTKFKLNLDSMNDKALSPLALGQLTYGESLLNVTNAYTPFANGGYMSNAKTYLYVTDNYGNIVLENNDESERILSEDTAFITTKLLEGVVTEGTARYLTFKNKSEISGKTGTSSDLKDRWFIGYTPSYVCGVWCGYDTPRPMYYAENPSCIFFDKVMNKVYENREYEYFYIPNGVVKCEYCMDSGNLVCHECTIDLRGDRTQTGYFKVGSEPKEYCSLHKKVVIDTEDGMIADALTPSFRRRTVSLLDYNRANEYGVDILDSEYFIENRKRK
jgi:penicillin-binding protein 1A